MPTISVIIPVYNAEKYLAESIESVLNQTFTDFELILVDDGSGDNSPAICRQYADQYQNIIAYRQQNGGPGCARNRGLSLAHGRYVTFIDADDTVDPTFLETALAGVEGNDLYISGIKMVMFAPTGTSQTVHGIDKSAHLTVKELFEQVEVAFRQICICSPCCKLYRRDIIAQNGIQFDQQLRSGEDTLFNLAYFEKINTVYFDRAVFYTYRRENDQSLFNKYRKDDYENIVTVYDRWRTFIQKIGVDQAAIDRFEQMYFSLLFGSITHVFQHSASHKNRAQIIKKVCMNPYIKGSTVKHPRWKYQILYTLLSYNLRMPAYCCFWLLVKQDGTLATGRKRK